MEVFSSMPPVWGMSPQLLAIIIMSICYLIIFSEKVNRAVIALLGAGLMIVSGILTQPAALKGIDFNTLALLTGMMIIGRHCRKVRHISVRGGLGGEKG